jgi:hypothetical protein
MLPFNSPESRQRAHRNVQYLIHKGREFILVTGELATVLRHPKPGVRQILRPWWTGSGSLEKLKTVVR